MSYLQIKQFIDEQIRILNTPLVITDDIRAMLKRAKVPEERLQSALFKANLQIKRDNRNRFNKQVVHQIVQQVAKSEKEKLHKVNAALEKISVLLRPILLPDFSSVGCLHDRIQMVNELAIELPEPAYLFALYEDVDFEQSESEGEDVEEDVLPHLLVQDGEERVITKTKGEMRREYTRAIQEELKGRLPGRAEVNEELKKHYTDVRTKIIGMNEELVYKMQKLEYLKKLNSKLQFLGAAETGADSDVDEPMEEEDTAEDIKAQANRFKILVEKLEFAMS